MAAIQYEPPEIPLFSGPGTQIEIPVTSESGTLNLATVSAAAMRTVLDPTWPTSKQRVAQWTGQIQFRSQTYLDGTVQYAAFYSLIGTELDTTGIWSLGITLTYPGGTVEAPTVFIRVVP